MVIKYRKLYIDNKYRRRYNEKKYRKEYLRYILGKKSNKQRKLLFKSYCMYNGSPRSVYGQFNMSRWMFKRFAYDGYLPGIRNYGW